MANTEETDFSVKSNENQNQNAAFSLLLPYYTTDKWTNKLKHKIKALSDKYNDFYKKLEQENNPYYKTNYNKYKTQEYFHNRTANNFMHHNKLFSNQIPNENFFHKTSTNFTNYKTNTSMMNTNENNNYNKKKILNEILPPVTNYNPNNENIVFDGVNYFNLNDNAISYLAPKTYNLFCISAQQRNQQANMNKYYSHRKNKDMFYFGNHKNMNSTKNLFSSKAHNEDFNKFMNECQSKERINFFKKNDYNPHLKSAQPKNRKQISALKDLRKKQYLDYIKAKSEDNYMKYYYNQ
jgi:hypothetical protein